jgi:hypothetical protein
MEAIEELSQEGLVSAHLTIVIFLFIFLKLNNKQGAVQLATTLALHGTETPEFETAITQCSA